MQTTPTLEEKAEQYVICNYDKCANNKKSIKMSYRENQKPKYCNTCGYRTVDYVEKDARNEEQDRIMNIIEDKGIKLDTINSMLRELNDSYLFKIAQNEKISPDIRSPSMLKLKDQELIYQSFIINRKIEIEATHKHTWNYVGNDAYHGAIHNLTLDNLTRLNQELNSNKDTSWCWVIEREITNRKQHVADQLLQSQQEKRISQNPKIGILTRIFGGRK